jgi:hypothetical protein
MRSLALFIAIFFSVTAYAKKPSIPYVGTGAVDVESPDQATIVGYVKMPLLGRMEALTVICLDEASTQRKGGGFLGAYRNGMLYPDKVFVAPGRHYLAVQYGAGAFYGRSYLWLDAKAGRTYALKVRDEGLQGAFWIEDAADSSLAGGAIEAIPGGASIKVCPGKA